MNVNAAVGMSGFTEMIFWRKHLRKSTLSPARFKRGAVEVDENERFAENFGTQLPFLG